MAEKSTTATAAQLAEVGIPYELCTLYEWALTATASVDESLQQNLVADRNAQTAQIKELWHKIDLLEQAASSIKSVVKKLYKVGPEKDLPKGISWNAETYTTKFSDPVTAIQKLLVATNTPWERLIKYVSPANAREACGVTDKKMDELVGDLITKTPKDRVLNMK